jgi:hypothetical protein
MLIGLFDNSKNALIRLVLARFFSNSKVGTVQKRFFLRLFHTSAGASIDSFQKWKGLPEKKDWEQLKRGG